MSFVRLGLQAIGNASRVGLQRVIAVRSISQSLVRSQEPANENIENDNSEDPESSDRTKVIPVETSIQYLKSDAYKTTYGDDPVWKKYRRNFKGQYAPPKTRKTCIRGGVLATSNPCPICRDVYLVLDHRNSKLLDQFISPFNGEIIDFKKTGICQMQHKNLLVAIHRAKNFGTISYDVPFRVYDYSEWYKPKAEESESEEK